MAATGIVVLFIVYGCLYPFAFEERVAGGGALDMLLSTWNQAPRSRGDLIANILLYLPLGFFGALSISGRVPAPAAALMVTAVGAALSLAMEFAQLFIQGRTSSMLDIYLNTAGAFAGAVAVFIVGTFRFRRVTRDGTFRLASVPSMLIASWLGYRLYPYVPVIDLGEYWNSLEPVLLAPGLGLYDLVRHVAVWLTAAHLADAVLGRERARPAVPLGILAVLGAEVVIIDTSLSLPEVAGAGLAVPLWMLMPARRQIRAAMVALLLLVVVVAGRLEPFQFAAAARPFGWIPFASFMHGSPELAIQSFLEKTFLYGSLLWLVAEAGLGLVWATVIEVLLLFATSVLQTHIPGRSAEVTDAAMAAVIGLAALLLARRDRPGRITAVQHAALSGRNDPMSQFPKNCV